MGWRNWFSRLNVLQRDRFKDAATADRQALQQLSQAGVDLREKIEILHYLYLPSQKAAEEIAVRLSTEEYKVTVRPAANADENPPNPWLVLASRAEEIDEEKLEVVREQMEGLVNPINGEYDGWEVGMPGQ